MLIGGTEPEFIMLTSLSSLKVQGHSAADRQTAETLTSRFLRRSEAVTTPASSDVADADAPKARPCRTGSLGERLPTIRRRTVACLP